MPSKYRAVRTEVDGIQFASKREAKRWQELRLLQRAGAICHLERQVRYPLHVRGVQIGAYVADFRYFDVKRQRSVVEDAKGMKTPIYQRSKKHIAAEYGIEIQEV